MPSLKFLTLQDKRNLHQSFMKILQKKVYEKKN